MGRFDRGGIHVAPGPLEDDHVVVDRKPQRLADHRRGEPLKGLTYAGSEDFLGRKRVRRSDVEDLIEVPVPARRLGPVGFAAATATRRRDDATAARLMSVRAEPGDERASGVGFETELEPLARTLDA